METGLTVGHYNFEAWDLPTKYGWMHSGPGVQAAAEVQDVVNRMSERMISSGRLVGNLLGGAEWAGAAATAAGQAVLRALKRRGIDAQQSRRPFAARGDIFALPSSPVCLVYCARLVSSITGRI